MCYITYHRISDCEARKEVIYVSKLHLSFYLYLMLFEIVINLTVKISVCI